MNKHIQFIKDQEIPNIKFDALRYVLNNNLLDDTGLVLEFGTWKGQTLDMISDFTDKPVYGFDTFEGVETSWEHIDMKKFNINGIPKTVNKLDKKTRHIATGVTKEFNSNVSFVKGLFEDILPTFLSVFSRIGRADHRDITFMHIDSDTYSSTKCIFDNCGSRITSGSIIVFDELVNYYGFENNEFKAFYEWVSNNDIEYEWIGMDGEVLTFDQLEFINNLNIDNTYTIYEDDLDWFQKARILNIRFSVAVKIINNPLHK